MVAASGIEVAMLDNGRRVPFYEYRRPDGTTLEVMQKMTDPPLTEDPETGVPLERVFHPIAVHFKGKGFYNTDYGTKKRAREKADHEGAKASDAKAAEAKKGESGSGSGSGDTGGSSAKPEAAPKTSTSSPAPKSD
jgi:predicted nucleic acid-binding Zn ribbon protein